MRKPYLENEFTRHPFYRLLSEIDECLEHKLYMSALALALTIPDICGHILYPASKINKFHYILWYEEFLGHYELHPDSAPNVFDDHDFFIKYGKFIYNYYFIAGNKGFQNKGLSELKEWPENMGYKVQDISYLSGAMVYALRCSLLHCCDSYSEKMKSYSFDFMHGPLIFQKKVYANSVEVKSEKGRINIICHVNIDGFCKCLIRVALNFFLDNFEAFREQKFDLMNAEDKYLQLFIPSYSHCIKWMYTVFDDEQESEENYNDSN